MPLKDNVDWMIQHELLDKSTLLSKEIYQRKKTLGVFYFLAPHMLELIIKVAN